MSDPADEQGQTPSVRRVAALLAANSSLLVAGLVYMGWSYTDAQWGYFHISPLNLDVGVVEYLLRSLNLFSPAVVTVSVVFVVVTSVFAWDLNLIVDDGAETESGTHSTGHDLVVSFGTSKMLTRDPRRLITFVGMIITAAGGTLVWAAGQVNVSTYLLLAFFVVGPVLLTWPARGHRYGGVQYSLAVVVAAVCLLWAGSIYAHNQGIKGAQKLVSGLPTATAVTVYSVHMLEISGPKVTFHDLGPSRYYRYEYGGLRLLTSRSGTYYLLPVGWTRREDLTYVVTDNDDVRIDLYSAVINAS
jgi:hypothetical protein